jgi:signal transduction histidine kinase
MPKILIIEDEPIIREMLVELLELEKYQCFSAENGKAGVDAAKTHLPDLIVCDIKMPEMNGHEVLNELQKDQLTSTIPFIFLSAMVDKKDLRKGMNLGADDYITKPFDPDDLIDAIKIRLAKNSQIKKKMKQLRESIALSLPHELQTPLISVIGYSQILMEKLKKKNKQEYEFAKTINEAGKRLNRLIQHFIAFSKLATSSKTRDSESALISAQYLEDVVSKISSKYEREDDLVMNLSDAYARIRFNDFLMIIEEIVDNAFKFSDEGSSVLVENSVTDNKYFLKVSDNGRGMTEEQQLNIGAYMQFERDQYEQQGSGLGLSISKKMIELYGGSFTIDSLYGKGTTVTVIIPAF